MYTIGIIGFGVVGKSVLAFFNKTRNDVNSTDIDNDHMYDQGFTRVQIWDNRKLRTDELDIISMYKAESVSSEDISLEDFIKNNDYILPSPGVDLSCFAEIYQHKILCELDFFSAFYNKPMIAITGSLGKTTTTKLISKIATSVPSTIECHVVQKKIQKRIQMAMAGNIGIGMLDLLSQQDIHDAAVLELSSFQLEYNSKYAPNIAVWINLYPNHLDRHKNEEEYCLAKYNLFLFQKEDQSALFSAQVLYTTTGRKFVLPRLKDLRSKIYIYFTGPIDFDLLISINVTTIGIFYIAVDGYITYALFCNGIVIKEFSLICAASLPDITFMENWLAIIGALYLMNINCYELQLFLKLSTHKLLADNYHRLEHFCTINDVDFYDDSKSTLMQATMAACQFLMTQKRPLIIILGGRCKGVDRSELNDFLKRVYLVKKIYCFGTECAAFCGASVLPTLEEVVKNIFAIMKAGDIVLFSPSGTSFDFFKNYQHRGDSFKKLVLAHNQI